jgi:hypothetical protein
MAAVKPRSFIMTELSTTQSGMKDKVARTELSTHAGTAGVMSDFPDEAGVVASLSSFSRTLFSVEMIRREDIVFYCWKEAASDEASVDERCVTLSR